MATQSISHPPSTRPAAAGQRAMDSVFKTVSRMADRAAAVAAPDSSGVTPMDCEVVENRMTALNQRYETVAAAATKAGAEYKFLRGFESIAALETQRRRWIRLEQWRRDVVAAIEQLEETVA